MSQILDSEYNSNSYFFLTNISETLNAGRNSFTINPTNLIVPNKPIFVKAYDPNGNELHCSEIKPTNARFFEQTNTGKLYFVNIEKATLNGIGNIKIRAIGVDLADYTGSIAYYNDQAYKVSVNQKLPLVSVPLTGLLTTSEVIWNRNFLIDTTRKTNSEVRFFDSPYVRIRSEICAVAKYPTLSYSLASGNFSSVAVSPKHNDNGDYDYQFDAAIYQLHWKSGTKFSSSMEGQSIRLKNPTITKFKYDEYQDPYQGTLNTDFIATIKKVVNQNSLLINIPFTTVFELINRTNEDSPYSKNNLVKIKGFAVNDNPYKQTVFHKNNFYALSITDGEFEIFYNNIPIELPRATISGSTYMASLVNIEFNNTRVLCGALDSYKIYGRKLDTPESKRLLTQGRIYADSSIISNKFDNAIRGNPAGFYSQAFMNKHWFISGGCTFYQDNTLLIDGAVIGHGDNSNLFDYVIYKDNTDAASLNSTYVSYNLLPSSYWYGNADAFINYAPMPTASYMGITAISPLSAYTNSQENLLSGTAHDSNSIKLRANSLYKFSMKVKAFPTNVDSSKLYVYYISGKNKTLIGYVDNSYSYGANELYENTFFSDTETFGTIILVPSYGNWYISSIDLKPHMNIDYSVDSFAIKVPIKPSTANELYEIEAELYDVKGGLAYGENSYTFAYNKKFMPLKNNVFIDPNGLVTSGTSFTPSIIDGGYP
jgi:hypothetical protein